MARFHAGGSNESTAVGAGASLVIRVTVTGSECTGKTTLAEALAAHYETAWSPEFARQFVLDKGAAPVYEDVDAIARGQIALEGESAREASHLLIHDTDLLSTILYSRHYFADCPRWIDQAFDEHAAHLYLLADTSIPWVPDGNQRGGGGGDGGGGGERETIQALFRSALIARHLPFAEIRGAHRERLNAAVSMIDPLLGSVER